MILCTNADKKDLLDFLIKKPSENCFFIGDVENFNLEDDFIDVWKFEKSGSVTSILLRYYKFYLISAEDEVDLKIIAEIINKDKSCVSVSGIEKTIDKISKYISFAKIKRTYLAELNRGSYKPVQTDPSPQQATTRDIDELFDFQKSIEEFSIDERNRAGFGHEIKTDTGKIFFIRKKGEIVSSATLTAVNSINGTIIAVATNPEYRKKGFAKACMNEICSAMIDDRKSVVLFYNNPEAGKLYKQLGFFDMGKWAMGTINQE